MFRQTFYVPCKKKKRTTSKGKQPRYVIHPPSEKNEKYFIGTVEIGTSNNIFPTSWTKCWFSVKSDDETDHLLIDFDGEIQCVVILSVDAPFVSKIPQSKIFSVLFAQEGEKIRISLHMNLPILQYTKQIHSVIKDVFGLVFNIADHSENPGKKSNILENIEELYRSVRSMQSMKDFEDIAIRSELLRPKLRQYQCDAVKWMIHRESTTKIESKSLHPAYCPVKLPSGIVIYYNKFVGLVEIDEPMVTPLPTGGILADEMGLGKTVEILACILSNPRYPDETVRNASPEIVTQGRKRQFAQDANEDNVSKYVDSSKVLKIKPDWVKGTSKKTEIRVALEMWYNNMLAGTSKTPKKSGSGSSSGAQKVILCLCGTNVEKNLVECVDCQRLQHSNCVGFNRKGDDGFRCSQCWKEKPPLPTKATLIICPNTLKEQWSSEISKHLKGNFKVLKYEGSGACPVYPEDFQNYDLVITTYNVLATEFRLSEAKQVKTLRCPAKYAIPGCPITFINWWRLCFDEAQVVDATVQLASSIAEKLHACHRWAITGTPISKGVHDLLAIIDSLRFEPYREQDTWYNLLVKPYANGNEKPMIEFLSKVLWRNNKIDVIDQIQIPEQKIIHHTIEFTAVERYFYEREHELSCSEFFKKLQRFDLSTPLSHLPKHDLKNLLAPLLSLRQACAHHHAVKGRYLATKKPVNSMQELLDALIAKNLGDCEDYLRAIISCCNGLAGIYLLLGNPSQTVEEYHAALFLAAKYSDDKNEELKLTVDKLQLIHTMHNLSEVLEDHPGLKNTMRDTRLKEDCAELESKFTQKFNTQTTNVMKQTNKILSEISDLEDKMTLKNGQWYAAIVEFISMRNMGDEFTNRISAYFSSNNYKEIKFPSERTYFYMAKTWEEEIDGIRVETMDSVNSLYDIAEEKIVIDRKLVENAADCHLRPVKNHKRKVVCQVCETNNILKTYESKLFFMTKQEDVANTGNWKPACEEIILREFYMFAKLKHFDVEVINEAEFALSIVDLYKKEFKELRKMWTFLDSYICALDEVDICKTRMRLKEDKGDKKEKIAVLKALSYNIDNPLEGINELDEHELDFQRLHIEGEKIESTRALEKCLGTHKYLRTLQGQQHSGQKPDPCPICKTTLDERWNILKCGHCYCIECMQVLLGNSSGRFLQCSMCRDKVTVDEINFVEINKAPVKDDEIKIRGNCSTKLEVITKLVLKLREDDVHVKVLIFSNWTIVLNVLKQVFDVNGITSEIMQNKNQKKIDIFKDEKQNITALLLPIQWGSKGLNLIEATHVIFVEPVLDPSQELQAIGRIHRIGQTRATFVHKILIKNSIEENIHQATTTKCQEWNRNKVTLQHIKHLFVDAKTSSFNDEIVLPVEADLTNEMNENEIEMENNCSEDDSDAESVENIVSNETTDNSGDSDEINEANSENNEDAIMENVEEMNENNRTAQKSDENICDENIQELEHENATSRCYIEESDDDEENDTEIVTKVTVGKRKNVKLVKLQNLAKVTKVSK